MRVSFLYTNFEFWVLASSPRVRFGSLLRVTLTLNNPFCETKQLLYKLFAEATGLPKNSFSLFFVHNAEQNWISMFTTYSMKIYVVFLKKNIKHQTALGLCLVINKFANFSDPSHMWLLILFFPPKFLNSPRGMSSIGLCVFHSASIRNIFSPSKNMHKY